MTHPDQPRTPLPPPAEPLSVAFANTRFWRGTATPEETLRTPEDLLAWLAGAGVPLVDAARTEWAATPGAAETALRTTRDLRETIYRLLAGPDPAPADLASLNLALAGAPERRRLERVAGGFAWRAGPCNGGLATLLAPVLWSVADLLVGSRRASLRTCANPQCRWVFLDDSKGGTRRWCSMASCGNRAKAHRHYARLQQQRGATK